MDATAWGIAEKARVRQERADLVHAALIAVPNGNYWQIEVETTGEVLVAIQGEKLGVSCEELNAEIKSLSRIEAIKREYAGY